MEKPTFKKICFMNFQKLTNFPYIENDFDALTNYEVMCKIVEYLNQVIANNNEQNKAIEELINFFENLDVQDEINNKLDEMAQSGELQEIISTYLNVNCVLSFNTLNDLKNATNIIDGSIAKTLNTNNNDGNGHFYKIRTITSSDTVDNDYIVSLNISNTLIAEKIYKKEIVVLLGDSYGLRNSTVGGSWGDKLESINSWIYGLDYFNFCTGNSGLTVENNNYLDNLRTNEIQIPNKNYVTKFIIAGGYNDNYFFSGSNQNSVYESKLNELVTYIKNNYPNAKIYMGLIGNMKSFNANGVRNVIISNALKGYNKIRNYENCYYMENIETIMHKYDNFMSDNVHPNEKGALLIANAINQCVFGGGYDGEYDNTQIQFSDVYMNVAQYGKYLVISTTGSCYPSIQITSTAQITFTTNYNISLDSLYLRNVNGTYSLIPQLANLVCTDNTIALCEVIISINSDGKIVLQITPQSNLVGKTIARLDFKFKPITLPIIYF